MIIEIEECVFNQIKDELLKSDTALYTQIKEIKPLENINPLLIARTIKTKRVKDNIKSTLRELLQSNITPSKYKVHKTTKIAYVTLNKYYDVILDEVQNEY